MKKLTNFILPVEIGMELDDVQSILFKFVQGNKTMLFQYPSAKATRKEGENTVLLRWTLEDTMVFSENRSIEMDTYIHLIDSDQNPETDIVSMTMNRTLFTQEEVADENNSTPTAEN